MKFRIVEKEDGNIIMIQSKRMFWRWVNARDHANSVRDYIGKGSNEDFHYYTTYGAAKDDLDRLIEYKLEALKRKKSKRVIHDEIDFSDKKERFLASL